MAARLALLAVLLLGRGEAHRPMVNGVSCGAQFSAPTTALRLPDPQTFWGAHRVVTCDGPVLWVNVTTPITISAFDISAGSLHSSTSGANAGRFENLTIDAVASGPTGPALDRDALPSEVSAQLGPGFERGHVLLGATDVSTCGHADTLGTWSRTVGSPPVCAFYDTFGLREG